MFHGFDYPEETGNAKLEARFWRPTMVEGVLKFSRPEDCAIRKFVRDMTPKRFGVGKNVQSVEAVSADWEA
jgi:CRISPR-associated protein Cas5d